MSSLYDVSKQDVEDVIDCLFEGIKSDSDSIDRLNKINESSASLAVGKNRQKKLIMLSKFRSILASLYIEPKEQADKKIIEKMYNEILKNNGLTNSLTFSDSQLEINFLNEEEAKMVKVEDNTTLISKIEGTEVNETE